MVQEIVRAFGLVLDDFIAAIWIVAGLLTTVIFSIADFFVYLISPTENPLDKKIRNLEAQLGQPPIGRAEFSRGALCKSRNPLILLASPRRRFANIGP